MEKNYNKRNDKPTKQAKHRINEFIKVPEVRVVGDNIENSGEVMRTDKALSLAYDMGLDLVETSPNAVPPIVKIVNYNKFLYNEEKKLKEMNKKQKENNKPLKEVQFSPHIGVADIETKTKHIREFIVDNHKVKVVMKFKQGREIQNSYDKGELVLYELIKNLEDVAKPEALPKLTGKTMIVTLNPKK
jgi:translation initiation factor IF-3